MRIVLLGAPGVGKGSVAKLLAQDGSVQISTGDMLRAAVKNGTDLGKKAKEYMDKGDLVPDSLIIDIIEARLQEPDCQNGFILDGFPRTILQAEELKKLLQKLNMKLAMVANLEVSLELILDRLTTRRTCSNPECQEIYNIKTKPPLPDGKCEKCGSLVIQRDDETGETIINRLETYKAKSEPLVGFYQKEGILRNFISLQSAETFKQIKNALAEIN